MATVWAATSSFSLAKPDLILLPAHRVPEYAAKYQLGFERIGLTTEQFAAAYSVALRVTPTSLRGH